MRIGRGLFGVIVLVGAGAAYFTYTHGGINGLMALVSPEAAQKAAMAAAPPPFAMPVPVAKVVKRTIPVTFDYSARTESIRNITLQARITGYVASQPATDGSDVKAGDLLYRIDPRDYKAALDQANAATQRDAANLDYQKSSFQRGDALVKSGFLAKDGFDQRNSSMRQAEAALVADQAAARAAQINLDYTEIKAPFPGRLGRNQAPLGALVGAGQTVLNTLVQLDPIYVTFDPSETDLAALQKAKAGGAVKASVTVPDAGTPAHQGELTFIDNAIDKLTGTVTARATIANGDFTLLPGQYVRVKVHLADQPNTLMVPQAAVGSSQLGKFVFVVSPDNKAEQKLVTLGDTDGDLVAVLKGVGPDDQIITGNLQKIGPGSPVKPLPEKVAAN